MTHYKLKIEDVARCLVSGDSNLTPDVLRQLLAFAPDDREVTMVANEQQKEKRKNKKNKKIETTTDNKQINTGKETLVQ